MNDATGTFHGALHPAQTGPQPLITWHRPAGPPNGMGMIIFPGGGYRALAPHEGPAYAEFYCAQGFTCFVVTYRLGSAGHRHPAMLEDAAAAVATVRQRAPEFGVRPDALAAIGSSAGGHLVALLSTQYLHYAWAAASRPDAALLCYPVISMRVHAIPVCRAALIGETPPDGLVDSVSCERHVHPAMPPCFIWHTRDDQIVPVQHSVMFAGALCAQGVPYELHVYQSGRHGLGLQAPYGWAGESVRWLHAVLAPRA